MVKRMTYLFVLTAAFGWTVLTALRPAPEDECLEEIRGIYRQLTSVEKAPGKNGKAFYMRYTMRSATADSTRNGIHQATVELLALGKNMEVKSNNSELYQDARDVFMVLHQRKMVFRSDADHRHTQSDQHRNRLQMIQDTVFTMSKVESCGTLANGDKQVVLKLNDKARTQLGLDRITFVYNPATKLIRKLKIRYAPVSKTLPGEVAWIEYDFHETSYAYTKRLPSGNVEKKFVSGGKLAPAYVSYKLIDNRYRKNPPVKDHVAQ